MPVSLFTVASGFIYRRRNVGVDNEPKAPLSRGMGGGGWVAVKVVKVQQESDWKASWMTGVPGGSLVLLWAAITLVSVNMSVFRAVVT